MEQYEKLADAIILQAVSDYRKALRALWMNPRNKEALAYKEDCESFFRSDWFKELTDLDGEMLIRRLTAEAA